MRHIGRVILFGRRFCRLLFSRSICCWRLWLCHADLGVMPAALLALKLAKLLLDFSVQVTDVAAALLYAVLHTVVNHTVELGIK